MKTTLTTSKAIDILLRDGYANWSVEEAKAIIEYYENLEEITSIEEELNLAGIHGEWDSYDSIEDTENYEYSHLIELENSVRTKR